MKVHVAGRWLIVAFAIAAIVLPAPDGVAAPLRRPGHPPVAETRVDSASLSDLPPAAQAQISAVLGRDQSSYHAAPQADGFRLANPKHGLAADFTPAGVRVRTGTASWQLSQLGYGYGDEPPAATTVAPQAVANRVEYRRGDLTEWYVNGPLGLEQGFTLSKAPGRRTGQPLTLSLKLSGNLTASTDATRKDLVLTRADGTPALRYRGLTAHDATGRGLPAWLQVEGERLWLRVDDMGAQYPLAVDPFIEQVKLTASDGAAGDRFGQSVAVSGDTIVVGTPEHDVGTNANQGSAYVFVRPAGGWSELITEQAKLVALDGAFNDQFGFSVALDGDTVVVGAPLDDVVHCCIGPNPFTRVDEGSAYAFVKPSGGWNGTLTESARLLPNVNSSSLFGRRVAVSGDTIVVGAPQASCARGGSSGFARQGEVLVFVKPASGWSGNRSPSAQLCSSTGGGGGGQLGISVAISGDTIVAGAHLDDTVTLNDDRGSASVFVRPAGGWSGNLNQNAKLTASDAGAGDQLGLSVAVDGDTVVVGAYLDDTFVIDQGSAYVFVRPAGGWSGTLTQQAKLIASDAAANDRLGTLVRVNDDTIIVVAPAADSILASDAGAAYFFMKPTGGWSGTSTETEKLTASDGATGDEFGLGLAVSGDIIVVGARRDDVGANLDQGSVYVFVRDQMPVANAGSDQSVNEDTVVTLDGSASTGRNLAFDWQQIAGPSVELSDSTSPTPSFTAPQLPGGFLSQVLTFQLTVTSGTQSSSDTVDVTVVNVNSAPVAEAGGDQTVNEGSLAMLDGSASFDPDGDTITHEWSQTGGPPVELTGAGTPEPSFTAPLLAGGTGGIETLTFDLTVSDGALFSTDTVQITVEQVNHAPVANAGVDQTRDEGAVVTLDGTGSNDPDGDPMTFTWSQVSGPLVALSDAHSPAPSFMAPLTGPGGATLVFELAVSDGFLSNEPALAEPDERVTINVVNLNDPPLCSAARPGPDLLWPPNHKMVQVGITGVADPDNDQVQITITGVTQDEPLIGLGDGDTSPDAVIQGDKVLLRAERSGNGNGRVYRITFTAGDSQSTGGSCAGSVDVGVPHSMKPGGSPVDDGQLYDSTLP